MRVCSAGWNTVASSAAADSAPETLPVGFIDRTYKRQTGDGLNHPEPRSWSDIVRGQDEIRPGLSTTKDVLRPVPSKNLNRVGIRPD